jgi:hypothetical protein
MEILGLVENMSGLTCPYCGKIIDIFKQRGGVKTAEKLKLKLLAVLPFDPDVVRKGDNGDMDLLNDSEHPITRAFEKMVDIIAEMSSEVKAPAAQSADVHAIG